MDIRKKIETLKSMYYYKLAMWRFRNRKVTKAKVLYWYLIFSGVGGFLYALSCIITGFPFWYSFSPIIALIAYFILSMLKKNAKTIWMYIKDMEKGKLLLSLDKYTHFEPAHKRKLLDWVYPPRRTIRNERWLELSERVRNGEKLSRSEKVEMNYRVATCPQQLQDGVNKAILVNMLIWAHLNIQVLDDNIREILDLTDANMLKFNLQDEINRCKVKKEQDKAKQYREKGFKIMKERNK